MSAFSECLYSLYAWFITGSIARSANRRYISYSDADFEVFRLAGQHIAPMGVKFGTEEWTDAYGLDICNCTIL